MHARMGVVCVACACACAWVVMSGARRASSSSSAASPGCSLSAKSLYAPAATTSETAWLRPSGSRVSRPAAEAVTVRLAAAEGTSVM